MRFPALITLASLFVLPSLAGAEVYSWKDASGKTIYSDKPPLERKSNPREIKTSRPSSDGDAAPATPAKGTDPGTSNTGSEAGKGPIKSPEQIKAEAEARQRLCDNAQKRLVQLESEKGILMTKNDTGESAPLVGDARKAETEAARKDVAHWCK